MNKNLLSAFFGGVCIGALVVFLVHLPKNPGDAELQIKTPDGKGEFTLHVTGSKEVEYDKILLGMFNDGFLRSAAIGWFAEQKDIYSITDERLATALNEKLCGAIPPLPLDVHLSKAKERSDKPIARRLRELAKDHSPPFQNDGEMLQMGVPEEDDDRPKPGHANVCRYKGYFNYRLQVTAPTGQGQRLVLVQATGQYACVDGAGFPDIQLSPEDAKKLFPARSLGRLEKVLVVPMEEL